MLYRNVRIISISIASLLILTSFYTEYVFKLLGIKYILDINKPAYLASKHTHFYTNNSTIQVKSKASKVLSDYSKQKSCVKPLLNGDQLKELKNNALPNPGEYPNTVIFSIGNFFNTNKSPDNVHAFKVTLNPYPAYIPECLPDSKNGLLLLAFIIIGPDFFDKRTTLRETWANQTFSDPNDLRAFFVVGKTTNKSVNDRINLEFEKYHDIIQEDYIDSYYNLTIKVLGAFKWMSEYCPRSKYVLRINDHMQVNTFAMIRYLRNLPNTIQSGSNSSGHYKNTIWGEIYSRAHIYRDNETKWFVPAEEYDFHTFLPYMEGSAFLLTGDLAIALYDLSKFVNWPRFSVSLEVRKMQEFILK
jgi:hypothetical protein